MTGAARMFAAALLIAPVARAAVAAAPAAVLAVGAPVPALEGATLDGRPFAARWSEGEATVVMFFATYCRPCHRALRELDAIRRTTGPRLRFVLVDAGEDPAAVRKFVAENPVPGQGAVVIDASGSDRRRWGCEIEPTLFLVDRAGRVRYINHGWGDGSEAKYLRRVRNVLAPGAVGQPPAGRGGDQ
ncbi:MAG TPA: TlpA disulfide reductase family protein [Polyangia bacterium]|nr:TlpA disulfide reductase family protein [Polyangia bacterium]